MTASNPKKYCSNLIKIFYLAYKEKNFSILCLL